MFVWVTVVQFSARVWCKWTDINWSRRLYVLDSCVAIDAVFCYVTWCCGVSSFWCSKTARILQDARSYLSSNKVSYSRRTETSDIEFAMSSTFLGKTGKYQICFHEIGLWPICRGQCPLSTQVSVYWLINIISLITIGTSHSATSISLRYFLFKSLKCRYDH